MAIELLGGAEVSFSQKERETLGQDFRNWVEQIEDDRRSMILDTYNKVQENLSGRAPVKSFPWVGASNVFAPLTGTYADALQSRLYEAATAHDPTNLVLPRGVGELLPGVDAERWADWWQRISRWVERDDMDHEALWEHVTLLMTHFGDAWIYLPWEEQWVADIEVTKGGKLNKTPRLLYGRCMPKVLHPKDVFIRWDADDHQHERLMGFQFELDLHTLDEWEKAGIYDRDVAAELRKKLRAQEFESKDEYRAGYFKQLGTRIYGPDEFEEKQKDLAKLHSESGNRTITMLKMFARADMDGDGVPEEIVYEVEKETGLVAYARYTLYAHRERPLIHTWFKKRPGSIYNIGVGEMMLNIQDIINTSLRDHFDNNKVQNASAVFIRKNSGIAKGKRLYPGATYFVSNPRDDVEVKSLGNGARATTMQEIGLLERWGQFIVGLSDFQLGQEPKSRTPATTMQASLAEANIRPTRIINVMRKQMRKLHRQVLMLYFQNGDPAKLAQIAAVEDEDVELFQNALAVVTPEQMAESLVIDPDVSSDALNRQARRQEAMALFAQLGGFYDRVNMIRQELGLMLQSGQVDPMGRAVLLAQLNGYIRAMKRILDTFEERDQREMLPVDLPQLMEGVFSAVQQQQQGGGAAVAPSPAQAAQGLVVGEGPASGPVAPEGRPVAGQPRVPVAAQANGGDRG